MQNNECVFICDQFTDYQENSLSSEIRAKVDAHLTVCPPCRSVFHELDEVLDTLHSLSNVEAGVDFTSNLLSRINDYEQESIWQKLSRSSYTKVAGYAIAAGLIVALGLNIWIAPISPANPSGVRSYTGEQKSQLLQTDALAEEMDSTLDQQSDSLSLRNNIISTSTSSLQLVSDTK